MSNNEAAREAAMFAVATNAPAARTPALTADDIHHRFSYHPPMSEERKNAHADVRDLCERLAMGIARLVPPSREASLAITKLEEAMMWANAALARSEDPNAPKEENE